MKSLLIGLSLIGIVCLANPVNNVVYADEIVTEENTTTEDVENTEETEETENTENTENEEGEVVEDDVTIDDTTTDSNDNSDDIIKDTDTNNNFITEKIEEVLELDVVKTVINAILDTGFLATLIVVLVKLNGEKKSREKLVKQLNVVLQKSIDENFTKLNKTQKEQLTDFINKVTSDIDLLKVAIALSQDKTAESKIELLKLISSVTNDKTQQNTISNVKNNVEEDKKKIDSIKEKLTSEYKEIF